MAKENKTFLFNAVKKSARAREYENALKWLEDAGLIYRATATGSAKSPVSHYADKACFKIYALDRELALNHGITKNDLLKAMQDHVLEEGCLMGKYAR